MGIYGREESFEKSSISSSAVVASSLGFSLSKSVELMLKKYPDGVLGKGVATDEAAGDEEEEEEEEAMEEIVEALGSISRWKSWT